jgi:hypothetical protein
MMRYVDQSAATGRVFSAMRRSLDFPGESSAFTRS